LTNAVAASSPLAGVLEVFAMVPISTVLAVADGGDGSRQWVGPHTVARVAGWAVGAVGHVADRLGGEPHTLPDSGSVVRAQAGGQDPITMAYERRGAGEPVVMLHGLGLNMHSWDPVVPLLSPERELIMIDLPGFGRSPDWPPSTPRDLTMAAAVFDEVFATLGVKRPHVVGHSLGGLIALRLGQAGLARSVTAIAPAGFWTAAERRYAFTMVAAARRLACSMPPAAVARLSRTAVGRAVLTGTFYANPARCTPDALIECLRSLRDAAGFTATLRAGRAPDLFTGDVTGVPVTIAWGTADRVLPARQAKRAKAMLPDAWLMWLPGCGHVPMNDAPELIARIILQATGSPVAALTRPVKGARS
jgi:pimeloyl-ACP methyl ester carboxylesterase